MSQYNIPQLNSLSEGRLGSDNSV